MGCKLGGSAFFLLLFFFLILEKKNIFVQVDPRWPVEQQVFLGPIPVSVTWDEIRNTFYTKVQCHACHPGQR